MMGGLVRNNQFLFSIAVCTKTGAGAWPGRQHFRRWLGGANFGATRAPVAPAADSKLDLALLPSANMCRSP
jgi:hypothetical protein